jgi:hypothetical protein
MRALMVLSVALFLSGCGGRIDKAKALAANQLRDPGSAQFRNIKQSGGFVCGEINGKNGYGAYNGFRRFYGTEDSVSIDPQDFSEPFKGLPSATEQFDQFWSTLCK